MVTWNWEERQRWLLKTSTEAGLSRSSCLPGPKVTGVACGPLSNGPFKSP